jgi:hypothetical protein
MAERAASQADETGNGGAGDANDGGPPKTIYLVSYPKIVYLYPSLLVAIGAGICMLISGSKESTFTHTVGLVFLGVLALNYMVLSFDFPRTTSLTLLFAGAAVFMGLVLLLRFNPDLVPFIHNFLKKLTPRANAQFYFFFAGILLAIYLMVAISVQFDYWEVRPNEVLHHHGMLSDLERFSAPNLRIDKEINDVFEYLLLRSGRLILHPSSERKAVVLENIFFISRKEREITRMLGALQVQVRTDR